MRVKFRSEDPAGGLRLLPEIPNFAIAQIEGRNGIGKSLAARLLELISGEQPYSSLPNAWSSLRTLLGTTEITVEEIPEVGTLVYHLDPASWPEEVPAQSSNFYPANLILHNGSPITSDAARHLFQARRIAGDEGIAETLGRILQEQATFATQEERDRRKLLLDWTREAEPIAGIATGISTDEQTALIARLQLSIANVKAARTSFAERAEQARASADTAQAAQEAITLLASFKRLRSAYLAAYEEYQSFTAEVRKAESELARSLVHRQITDRNRSRLLEVDRLLSLRLRAYARAKNNESQALQTMGLLARPDAAELIALRRSLQQQRAALVDQLHEADQAGEVRTLVNGLIGVATSRPPVTLSAPVIVSPVRLTGTQMLTGLRARDRELRDLPRPGEAVRLNRDIAAIDRQLLLLDRIPQLTAITDRKNDLVVAARQEIAELEGRTSTVAAPDQPDLQTARQNQETATLRAATIQSEIRHLLHGGDSKSGQQELDDLLEESAVLDEDDADVPELSDSLDDPGSFDELLTEELEKRVALIRATELVDTDSIRFGGDADALRARLERVLPAALSAATEDQHKLRKASDELKSFETFMETSQDGLTVFTLRVSNGVAALLSADGRYIDWLPGLNACASQAGTSLEELQTWLGSFSAADLVNALGSGEQDETFDKATDFIATVGRVVDHVLESLARNLDTWSSVSQFLTRTSSRLINRESLDLNVGEISPRTARIHRRMTLWTEERLSSLLSTSELRHELFDDAEEVLFDLTSLAVSWRSPDGRRRRRPLEAFSSGEQVFAYTRAKLEQLRDFNTSATATLLILDEFGAFVARDRFGELMAFVQHEALGRIADQVVVLLPLSTDGIEKLVQAEASDGEIVVFEDYIAESAGFSR